MEEWRRIFRDHVVEQFRSLPADGPDLNEMVTFAELVAEEVGPELRTHGLDESALQAEAFAAFRTCALFALANQLAALQHLAWAEGRKVEPGEAQALVDEFTAPPFSTLFYKPMLNHVGIFSDDVQERALRSMLDQVGEF